MVIRFFILAACGTQIHFMIKKIKACSTCNEEDCEDEGICKWNNGKCSDVDDANEKDSYKPWSKFLSKCYLLSPTH